MRKGTLVEITKLRAAPDALLPPGQWGEFQLGMINPHCSLPVDYVIVGLLIEPIRKGKPVQVMRLARNDRSVLGLFRSSTVIAFAPDWFITLNSVYHIREFPDSPPQQEGVGERQPN